MMLCSWIISTCVSGVWTNAVFGSHLTLRQPPEEAVCPAEWLCACLTAVHCLSRQDCFMRPGPPNFFMSLQKWHSPHSVLMQAWQRRHRVRLRLAPPPSALLPDIPEQVSWTETQRKTVDQLLYLHLPPQPKQRWQLHPDLAAISVAVQNSVFPGRWNTAELPDSMWFTVTVWSILVLLKMEPTANQGGGRAGGPLMLIICFLLQVTITASWSRNVRLINPRIYWQKNIFQQNLNLCATADFQLEHFLTFNFVKGKLKIWWNHTSVQTLMDIVQYCLHVYGR